MDRRLFLKISGSMAAMGGALLQSTPVLAAKFPTKPIRLLVGFSAGGATDIVVRALAESASKIFGQAVIVENKPGAGGVLPAQQLQHSSADGHTLGIIPVSVFRMPYIGKLNWDPATDLEYVIRLTGFLWGLVVPADSPIKTFQDYVDYAKSHPGDLSYGTVGSLTTQHLTMEQISRQLGIKLNHIPFKGVAEAIPAMLGGHIMSIADASSWIPQVEAGKMRLLVVWSEQRVARFPDVPTLKEVGIDMVQTSPWGLAAPKGTPAGVVEALHDGFRQAMEQAPFKAALAQYDMEAQYLDGPHFQQFAVETMKKEKQILESLNFKKPD